MNIQVHLSLYKVDQVNLIFYKQTIHSAIPQFEFYRLINSSNLQKQYLYRQRSVTQKKFQKINCRMSAFYSIIYLASNIFWPILALIYVEGQSYSSYTLKKACKQQQTKNKQPQSQQISKQLEIDNQIRQNQCQYGKWLIMIITVLFFNILTEIFRKNMTVILLGFILKMSVVYLPRSVTQSVQGMVQKLHLEMYLQRLQSKCIDYYLQGTEKLNSHILHNQIQNRQQKTNVLYHLKDSVSKLEIQLEQNEEIKNRSFIVASKRLSALKSRIKCFENVGVNCDILQSDQLNRQILKILSYKRFPKEKPNVSSQNPSMIQEPTKDHIIHENLQPQKSAIYPSAISHSLQQGKPIKNNPTSEVKHIRKQGQKYQVFMIKRSKTEITDQFDSEQSPTRIRQNKNVQIPEKQQRRMTKKGKQLQYNLRPFTQKLLQQGVSSKISNQHNVGMIDIVTSDHSRNKRGAESPNLSSFNRVLQSQNSKYGMPRSGSAIKQEASSPLILPQGVSISNIEQKSHLFKLNMSNLSNPLLPSGTLSRSKILPNSLYMSSSNKLLTENKNEGLSGISQNLINKQFSNVSQVKTQTMINHFSQESSILNKGQVSISESEYSDIFDSEGQEEQAKLQIKVQAVVQNSNSQKGLRPKLDICNIELYQNRQVKFLSLYDKITFHGRILRMEKKIDNYYDLILESIVKSQPGKQKKQAQQPIETAKKVKFRGQAKPFMKYLQKTGK